MFIYIYISYITETADTNNVETLTNMVSLLFYIFGALRSKEVWAMCWDDLVFRNNGNILVIIGNRKQGGRPHRFIIPDTLIKPGGKRTYAALIQLYRKYLETSGFPGHGHVRILRRAGKDNNRFMKQFWGLNKVRSTLARCCEYMGKDASKMSSHGLRRFSASQVVANGGSISDLLSVGQWSSTKTAQRYVHQNEKRRERLSGLILPDASKTVEKKRVVLKSIKQARESIYFLFFGIKFLCVKYCIFDL